MSDWQKYMSLAAGALSPDELVAAASWVQLEVDVLSEGSAPSTLSCVRSWDGWGIDVAGINSHVRAAGGLHPRCVALLIVDNPGDANICGRFLDRVVVLAMPAGAEITAAIKPGLSYTTVVVPEELWRDGLALASGGRVGPSRFSEAFSVPAERARALVGKCRRLVDRLSTEGGPGNGGTPEALVDYVAELADVCSDDVAVPLEHGPRERLRHAWAAQHYLHDHMGEEVSIMRVCREVGVSRRQLEYSFHTTFGVGPRNFLQALRLNESRRRLMMARSRGETVTQVAMDVGVTHLGRYAQYYRRLFGETPRETLDRAGRS